MYMVMSFLLLAYGEDTIVTPKGIFNNMKNTIQLNSTYMHNTKSNEYNIIISASDKNARVSCPVRQRNCNLISSATLPKS